MPKMNLNLILLAAGLMTVGCAQVQKAAPERFSAPPTITASPFLTATSTSTPTPTPVVSSSLGQTLTLAFTGDIMMGGSASYKLKTEGPDAFFIHTAPYLKQADIVMGNLEGPLGTSGQKCPHKKYNFLIDPSCAPGLARAGFTLMTLANNHIMDFGPEALRSTIIALEEAGLKHAGAGSNLEEARTPAWLELKGHKVAVLAYSRTEPVEYWAAESRAGCAAALEQTMREDITGAKARGADLVIVVCHWGQEKKTKLRFYQPELAHMAIDAGADAVVGHHPHIWQGLEVYHGKPIAYAIGNFCFGSLSTSTVQSGILYLNFDGKNRWIGGRVLPLNVNNYQVQFAAQPMKEKQAGKFLEYLRGLSDTADLSLTTDLEYQWKAPSSLAGVNPIPTPQVEQNPNGGVPGLTQP